MVFQIAMSLIKTLFQPAKLSIITQKAVSKEVFVPLFNPFFWFTSTLQKDFTPFSEPFSAFITELCHTVIGLLHGFLGGQASFRKEFVSKAYKLLFNRHWHQFTARHRQALFLYLTERQSCPCMALTHQCMARETFVAHKVCTESTMTNIGSIAKALNARSIAQENPYIMEHRGLLDKLKVDIKFRVGMGYGKSLVSHAAAMRQKYVAKFVILRVILVNDSHVIHIFPILFALL